MDLSQIDSLSAIAAKARVLIDSPVAILASSIIKDEEGQIKWSSIITGGLTACVIAAGTSLISLNNKVAELAVVSAQRGQYIEQIPAALERLRIGQLSGPGAKWDFDGADLGTIQANAYGDFLSFGSGGNAVTAVRYSNRVYGLSLADGANNSAWWRPPMSPDVVSAYPADLHVQAKPFGTYQPITKLFAWETGFVNFV